MTVLTSGVQELELQPEVLAGSRNDLGDLRLVREGVQVPYLLERTSLARPLRLELVAANDPKQPRISQWEIKLPRAGVPLTRLTLATSTPLFQRHFRVTEKVSSPRRDDYDQVVAEGDWSKVPSSTTPFVMPFIGTPQTDRLLLTTDNGDNPPPTLTSAEAAYPVIRLYFKADPGPLSLYYGNAESFAPRYDLSLVAPQILAAEKSVATLAAEELLKSDGTRLGVRAGVWFWGALALVVVVLLVVVAKLLPKPPTNAA